MGPPGINKPLRTVEKKKLSGCRSMKTLKRKAKMKKNRKVLWKKLILPNMEIDDDVPQRRVPSTKPLTGKRKRKLRKRMIRLIKAQESKMEDVQTAKADEKSPEDAEKDVKGEEDEDDNKDENKDEDAEMQENE